MFVSVFQANALIRGFLSGMFLRRIIEVRMEIWRFPLPFGNLEISVTLWEFGDLRYPLGIWTFPLPFGNLRFSYPLGMRKALFHCGASRGEGAALVVRSLSHAREHRFWQAGHREFFRFVAVPHLRVFSLLVKAKYSTATVFNMGNRASQKNSPNKQSYVRAVPTVHNKKKTNKSKKNTANTKPN